MSVLNHPLLSSRYFFPREEMPPQPFWVESEGNRLCCYKHSPHPHALTLVHFHGNGEVVADYIPEFAEQLADIGLNSFFVEYRGYGGSTGEPTLTSLLQDVPMVVGSLGLSTERLVPFGRSLGSLYAVEMAHRFPKVPALIIESGIADLMERVLLRVKPEDLGVSKEKLSWEVLHYFDQKKKLSSYRGRTLVMHAKDDTIIDVEHARRNAAWAAGPSMLKLFPQGDHNSVFSENPREYLLALQQFLVELK